MPLAIILLTRMDRVHTLGLEQKRVVLFARRSLNEAVAISGLCQVAKDGFLSKLSNSVPSQLSG